MKRWTNDEYQQLIGMWLREEPAEEIAGHFGLSMSGLNKKIQRLRQNGVPLPLRRAGHKSARRNCPWTQEEVETLARMRGERKSTTEIATALNRTFYGTQAMILKLRNEEDVPLPKLSHGLRRLWDADRLREAIAVRGVMEDDMRPALRVVNGRH